ncbi:MAG: hypothetical protein FWG11_08375 [Promicromonosporaceae bacterium]|nr:hypothetical protein [Promicromonosporaceae bacterium]
MYGALWRNLPGHWTVRLLLLLALLVALLYALFMWVYPWVNDTLNLFDPVVQDESLALLSAILVR